MEMRKLVLSNRAQSFLKLKKYEQAERDSAAALQLDPAHLKSMQRHATALFYLRRFKQAQSELDKVLQIEPSSALNEYLVKCKEKLA